MFALCRTNLQGYPPLTTFEVCPLVIFRQVIHSNDLVSSTTSNFTKSIVFLTASAQKNALSKHFKNQKMEVLSDELASYWFWVLKRFKNFLLTHSMIFFCFEFLTCCLQHTRALSEIGFMNTHCHLNNLFFKFHHRDLNFLNLSLTPDHLYINSFSAKIWGR